MAMVTFLLHAFFSLVGTTRDLWSFLDLPVNAHVPPSIVIVIALGFSFTLSVLLRTFYPSCRSISWSTTILVGLIGSLAGFIIGTVFGGDYLPGWVLAVCSAVVCTIIGLSAVSKIAKDQSHTTSLDEVNIGGGENQRLEFKAYARYNPRTRKADEAVEHATIRAVASFLNAEGGVLLLGVNDTGKHVGVAEDVALSKNGTLDGYELWLRDIFVKNFGTVVVKNLISITFAIDQETKNTIVIVSVLPSRNLIFVKYRGTEHFYVRIGNSTRSLSVSETLKHVRKKPVRRTF